MKDDDDDSEFKMLNNCDFMLASIALANKLFGSVIPNELAELLDLYSQNPCEETARKILKFDYAFFIFFEQSNPGGFFDRNRKWVITSLIQKFNKDDVDCSGNCVTCFKRNICIIYPDVKEYWSLVDPGV